MAGFLIGIVAFALPFGFGALGVGRPRLVLTVGGVIAAVWVIGAAAGRTTDQNGNAFVPLWVLGGLVCLLYAIWCGGLWMGLRLRRIRRATSG